jgi:hypothetical protein
MKITKQGNPDKIAKIKEKREESRNPEICCSHCDAQFRIQASEVQTQPTCQEGERIKYYVNCPCCNTEIDVTHCLPSDYEKKDKYQLVQYPFVTGGPTLTTKNPMGGPGFFVVQNPIDDPFNPFKVIC